MTYQEKSRTPPAAGRRWLPGVWLAVLSVGCAQPTEGPGDQGPLEAWELGDRGEVLEEAGWDGETWQVVAGFQGEPGWSAKLGEGEDGRTVVPVPGFSAEAQDLQNTPLALVRVDPEKAPGERFQFIARSVARQTAETVVFPERVTGGQLEPGAVDEASKEPLSYVLARPRGDELVILTGVVQRATEDKPQPISSGLRRVLAVPGRIRASLGNKGQYWLPGPAGRIDAVAVTINPEKAREARLPPESVFPVSFAGRLDPAQSEVAQQRYDRLFGGEQDGGGGGDRFAVAAQTSDGQQVPSWESGRAEKIRRGELNVVLQRNDLTLEPWPQGAQPPAPDETRGRPEIPTPEKQAEPEAEKDAVFVTKAYRRFEVPHMDFDCSGLQSDGSTPTRVLDLAGFQGEAWQKGWKWSGDARIGSAFHAELFDAPREVRQRAPGYLDELTGYCLLTTGAAVSASLGEEASLYGPRRNGRNELAELWQKVHVPQEAKSFQLRAVLLTEEEWPWVEAPFLDGFFIRLNEPGLSLASGRLRDLAESHVEGSASSDECEQPCGLWNELSDSSEVAGTGGIAESPESLAGRYKLRTEPFVLCGSISKELRGEIVTLRMGVFDGGEPYADTALAVDSMVFAKEPCGSGPSFSGDPMWDGSK